MAYISQQTHCVNETSNDKEGLHYIMPINDQHWGYICENLQGNVKNFIASLTQKAVTCVSLTSSIKIGLKDGIAMLGIGKN